MFSADNISVMIPRDHGSIGTMTGFKLARRIQAMAERFLNGDAAPTMAQGWTGLAWRRDRD
jgi:hypothetical protein